MHSFSMFDFRIFAIVVLFQTLLHTKVDGRQQGVVPRMFIVYLPLCFYRIILSKFYTRSHINKVTKYEKHVDFTIVECVAPSFLLHCCLLPHFQSFTRMKKNVLS